MRRRFPILPALLVVAVLAAASGRLLPREAAIAPPEDFRTRLSSTGSMVIGWENKQITIDGEDKRALVTLLNGLTIEPTPDGPEPTHAPGYLFWIESKSETGSKEASISIQGMQRMREYFGDKLIDYILPEQDYQTLCGALDELFQSKHKPDA
ncbi:MAG: hypothetical protein AAGU77_02700 [Bacillota bacterium]